MIIGAGPAGIIAAVHAARKEAAGDVATVGDIDHNGVERELIAMIDEERLKLFNRSRGQICFRYKFIKAN